MPIQCQQSTLRGNPPSCATQPYPSELKIGIKVIQKNITTNAGILHLSKFGARTDRWTMSKTSNMADIRMAAQQSR